MCVCVFVCVRVFVCGCVFARSFLLVCRLEGGVGVHACWREREGERGGWESTVSVSVCAHPCVMICLDFFLFF